MLIKNLYSTNWPIGRKSHRHLLVPLQCVHIQSYSWWTQNSPRFIYQLAILDLDMKALEVQCNGLDLKPRQHSNITRSKYPLDGTHAWLAMM